MGFQKKGEEPQKSSMKKIGQLPRVTTSFNYKGIQIGDRESVDIFISKSVDQLPGESLEDAKKRIEKTDPLTEILLDNVSTTVATKVKLIKEHLSK